MSSNRNPFQKISRQKIKVRMAICGPSGSGKTWTAIEVARGLVGPSGRIAVIDTEHGSATKSAPPDADFDSIDMTDHDPRNYVDMIHAAEANGYDALVIDSLSHAWIGRGGALELVDQAAKRSKSTNTFAAWKDVTPLHNQLIEAIVGSTCHIIATMRTKTEYVVEANERGRQAPRKVGTAPVQRDGMDYEFDIQGDMDRDHNFAIEKTRAVFSDLDGKVIARPGQPLGEFLASRANAGVDPVSRSAEAPVRDWRAPGDETESNGHAREPARPDPSKPKPGIIDVSVLGWRSPTGGGQDTRSYPDVAKVAVAEAMLELQAFVRDSGLESINPKTIAPGMVHAHIFGLAVKEGYVADIPKESRTTAKAMQAITEHVYPSHRDWVRGEINSFLDRQREAAEDALIPAEAEPGDVEAEVAPF